jgi:isopentenyldiphosphate isomerase
MNDDDEILDLVDKDDKVIGTIKHADAPGLINTKAGYVRGSVVFIQNSKGQLWTPKRTAHKKVAPNGLDFGVAEHVQSGESYLQGIIRGFKEELYLEVQAKNIKQLGILKPIPSELYFFIVVFIYNADEVLEYNPEDYTDFKWLYPKEIVELIEEGAPSKSALKLALETFLL